MPSPPFGWAPDSRDWRSSLTSHRSGSTAAIHTHPRSLSIYMCIYIYVYIYICIYIYVYMYIYICIYIYVYMYIYIYIYYIILYYILLYYIIVYYILLYYIYIYISHKLMNVWPTIYNGYPKCDIPSGVIGHGANSWSKWRLSMENNL